MPPVAAGDFVIIVADANFVNTLLELFFMGIDKTVVICYHDIMFVVGAKHDFASFVYYEDSEEATARETFENWSKTNKSAFIAYVLSRSINGETETFAMVFGEEVPEEDSEQD